MTTALSAVHSKQCPNKKYLVIKGEQKRSLKNVRTLKKGVQASYTKKLPVVLTASYKNISDKRESVLKVLSIHRERVGTITALTHSEAAWLKSKANF